MRLLNNIKIEKGQTISGPITNLIIIMIATNSNIAILQKDTVIYANILLILFNLLPIYPLDGGRILKSNLQIIFGRKKSEKYINNISFATVLILTLISSILIYYLKNIAIFLIIIFLWALNIKQDIIYKRKNKIYDLMQKSIEIK